MESCGYDCDTKPGKNILQPKKAWKEHSPAQEISCWCQQLQLRAPLCVPGWPGVHQHSRGCAGEEFNVVRGFTQQKLLLFHFPAVFLFCCGCCRTTQSGLKHGKSHYLSIVIPIFFCILCEASANPSTSSLQHCKNHWYVPLKINSYFLEFAYKYWWTEELFCSVLYICTTTGIFALCHTTLPP